VNLFDRPALFDRKRMTLRKFQSSFGVTLFICFQFIFILRFSTSTGTHRNPVPFALSGDILHTFLINFIACTQCCSFVLHSTAPLWKNDERHVWFKDWLVLLWFMPYTHTHTHTHTPHPPTFACIKNFGVQSTPPATFAAIRKASQSQSQSQRILDRNAAEWRGWTAMALGEP